MGTAGEVVMAEFSIGEVERLTGLKGHVLRYWEEAVPFIRPRKDDIGRRYYSARDVELIQRLRFLVYEKKYTLAGAGERMLAELTDYRYQQIKPSLDAVRADLMGVYALVRSRLADADDKENQQ